MEEPEWRKLRADVSAQSILLATLLVGLRTHAVMSQTALENILTIARKQAGALEESPDSLAFQAGVEVQRAMEDLLRLIQPDRLAAYPEPARPPDRR